MSKYTMDEISLSILSTVVDIVAALSCEAAKADVAEVVKYFDSAEKDSNAVANDMKELLVGSKYVGRGVKNVVFTEIPEVHGSFREVVRAIRSSVRKLSTGMSIGDNVLVTKFGSLRSGLASLGKMSLGRAQLSIDSINDEDVRSRVVEIIKRSGGSFESFDTLRTGLELSLQAPAPQDGKTLVQELNISLQRVWQIVAWEATLALLVLKINEASAELKNDMKKKKQKGSLGKGTTVVRELLIEAIYSECGAETLELLEKWTQELSLFFDPKDSKFNSFLKAVKEILESNELTRLPKIPKGTRDFGKEQMTIRKDTFMIIEDIFEMHGATCLDTPVFERKETLTGKYGEDSKLIYDLADQGGELCSLRYDLTVPLARYVAMNGLSSLKRYQIGKVYRRDNPAKGRFREFYQCDLDIVGQYGVTTKDQTKMYELPDFEVIKILTELLDKLEMPNYEIKLNHRKLLDAMLEICGVSSDKFRTICSSIDKLDKQTLDEIKKEMVEEKGLSAETADKIGAWVVKRGPPSEILSELKQEGSPFLKHRGSLLALNDLELLFKALDKSKCTDRVVFDLSLARGLDYYTGVIFEAVLKGSTQVGSIAAGGRYDNLIGMFGTKSVPAVGVSLGLERVITIREDLASNKVVRATKTEVLVSILSEEEDGLLEAVELVSELWNVGIKAEYMAVKRTQKPYDRAVGSKIPWMVTLGETEKKADQLKIKDMESKKEVLVPRSNVIEELLKRLKKTVP